MCVGHGQNPRLPPPATPLPLNISVSQFTNKILQTALILKLTFLFLISNNYGDLDFDILSTEDDENLATYLKC